VLHVVSGDLWAGAEVQAYTLMSALAKMPATAVAAALMNEGLLAQKLRQAQIPVTVLDERRLSPVQIFAGLRGLMLTLNPDVVHTHRTKENIVGSLANRFAHNVPSVRTVHGGGENRPHGFLPRLRHSVLRQVDRWCAKRLQLRTIAVSAELRNRISQELPEEKTVVIENGVNANQLLEEVVAADFRTRDPWSTHVGIVGRLVSVKRVDLFLGAAAMLRQRTPERPLRFHVFGDGPQLGELRELTERLGLQPWVTFHGHRADSAACIAGLDVIVMCSDHEGMPMTALEAAALGVPMVAHAVGGLPEVVPSEFLVADHSAHGYGNAISRALAADARAIAAAKSVQVLQDYSSTRNAARVRALYEQVCGWPSA
jgi:glycosyltransferase involved in cell wall biosynthesis